MPDLAAALLALALHDRPPTESGVWLDAPPKPGTVVTAPLDLAGETQALEGVLKVEAFVVRGTSVTSVASYVPDLPLGTVPFELTWDPAGTKPGRVTIRVVATTLARGFSTEVEGLVVPAVSDEAPPRRVPVTEAPRPLPRPAPYVARPAFRRAARTVVAAPVLDTSGRAFGSVAPVLPYEVARPATPPPVESYVPPAVAMEPLPVTDRSGWLSLAGGLLLLLVCSHLHRLLRPQPVPRER
jgi:hypothetical protein